MDIFISFELVLDFCDIENKKNLSMEISNLEQSQQVALFVFLSGLISIADWIASNEDLFDFFIEFETISEFKDNYFALSTQRAKKALKKIGWLAWQRTNNKSIALSFKDIFGFSNLRPLQNTVVQKSNQILTNL